MNSEITKQTEHAQVGELLPPEPDTRALNGVTHGMTAQHVPLDERESYAQHVEQVRTASGALGYLEQRLADRAALALWRLDRVARYEAAQSSAARRKVAQEIDSGTLFGAAEAVTAAYKRLSALCVESAEHLRADPTLSEDQAQRHEVDAVYLEQIASGGSAAGCTPDEAYTLGMALSEALQNVKVSPAQMVRAMMDRPPKRGEAACVEDEEWEYQPEEIPGLLALYRERVGKLAPALLEGYAGRERQKAAQIRAAQIEALNAQADALALAALPKADVLEKVTRYEAHLERVLYRALHDLEAARSARAGRAGPLPLRGVLDERQE